MTVANFESTFKPLPYSATVAESTTVIVYRTDLRRIRNDNDERAWIETQETLGPGTEFRFAECRDGFYNAELIDGGRFIIGVDFVSDARRPKQQQHSDDDQATTTTTHNTTRTTTMGVLPDWVIGERVHINPKAQQDDREGVISYGVSSYGYDARLGRKFKICNDRRPDDATTIIDPKNIDRDAIFTDHEGSFCIIPPHGFILGETVETFEIPRDCIAICVGKSTYARCGIIVNVTPLEPEWKGKITIEISNTTPFPVKVYAGEGIMQVLFLTGASTCDVSYADKCGKYQGQRGVTLPIVK